MSGTEPAHDFGEVPSDWVYVDGHPFPPQWSVLGEVPVPRHNWGDVMVCHECQRAWLIRKGEPMPGTPEKPA